MSYGLLFRCDPMSVLDRPAREWPAVLALIAVADERIRKAREAVKRG